MRSVNELLRMPVEPPFLICGCSSPLCSLNGTSGCYATGLQSLFAGMSAQTILPIDQQALLVQSVNDPTAAVQLVERLGDSWEKGRLPTDFGSMLERLFGIAQIALMQGVYAHQEEPPTMHRGPPHPATSCPFPDSPGDQMNTSPQSVFRVGAALRLLGTIATGVLLEASAAHATEAYAQSTSKSCDYCHTSPAGGALNTAGEAFKKNGYKLPSGNVAAAWLNRSGSKATAG